MARRPKGVGDDINKFVRNVTSPWLGSGPTTPKQVVRAKEFTRTLVEQADEFGTGGLGKAAMQGPAQLAKRAALNAAVAGATAGLVRGVQVSGLAARVGNIVRGERVIVHGTGNPLVGDMLQPHVGSLARPDESVLYGWNPKHDGGDWIPTNVQEYAFKAPEGVTVKPQVVVAKVPRRASTVDPSNPAIVVSTEPARISSIVNPAQSHIGYVRDLNAAMRRAGQPINNMVTDNKVAKRIRQAQRAWKAKRTDLEGTA